MDSHRRAGRGPDSEQESARPGLSRSPSHQTLPSFRELLPPELHEAIESSPYDTIQRNQSSTPTSPNYQSSGPRSLSLATSGGRQDRSSAMPSLAEGFDELAGRYKSSAETQVQTRRPSVSIPPSSGHTVYTESFHSPPLSQNYRTRSPSPSLPPIRDLQSLSERGVIGEGHHSGSSSQYSNPGRSYMHGPQSVSEPENSVYSSRPPISYSPASRPTLQLPQMSGHLAGVSTYGRYAPHTYDSGRATGYLGQYSDTEYAQSVHASQHSNFGVIGADSLDSRNKRRRGNLPKPVTDILRAWFHEHLDHPYPSEEDKQIFIARTGLSISQISNWFINARRRQLPALRNQVRSQDHDRGNMAHSISDLETMSSHEPSLSPQSR